MTQKAKLVLVGLAGILAGAALTLNLPAIADKDAETALPIEELRAFTDVFARIKSDYVEPVDDKKLISSAINGMLSGLDPHSACLDAEGFKDLQVRTQGRRQTHRADPDPRGHQDPQRQIQIAGNRVRLRARDAIPGTYRRTAGRGPGQALQGQQDAAQGPDPGSAQRPGRPAEWGSGGSGGFRQAGQPGGIHGRAYRGCEDAVDRQPGKLPAPDAA